MALTIQDIANMANVSKATVSKVCNNSPEISRETAERVQRIMAEHNFQPRPRQKHRRTPHSKNIALIMEQPSRYIFTNPFLCEVLVGICEVISSHGYTISFYWNSDYNFVDLYKKQQMDGILFLMPSYHNPRVEPLVAAGCPLVCIGEHSLKDRVRYIDSDDANGIYNCVQYLYDQNHRRIAFLGGNPSLASGINRLNGYRRALADLGLPYDESIVLHSNINLQDDGEVLMNKILDRTDAPTGIVCFNDLIAAGAIRAIKRQGFRVPQDFSVTGFDDIPLCELIEPRLTSVHNIASRKGKDAAQWLIDVIENGSESVVSRPILLPLNLVLRDSTRRI